MSTADSTCMSRSTTVSQHNLRYSHSINDVRKPMLEKNALITLDDRKMTDSAKTILSSRLFHVPHQPKRSRNIWTVNTIQVVSLVPSLLRKTERLGITMLMMLKASLTIMSHDSQIVPHIYRFPHGKATRYGQNWHMSYFFSGEIGCTNLDFCVFACCVKWSHFVVVFCGC